MRIQFVLVLALATVALGSCTKIQPISGPIQVDLIQPSGTGTHCEYKIAPATINTLSSIAPMQGSLGKVLYSSRDLGLEQNQEEMILEGQGFSPIDVVFSKSGNVYHPMDYASLYTASLYWSLEQAQQLFASLYSGADILKLVPDAAETIVLHEAKYTEEATQRKESCDESGDCNITRRVRVTDNAAFLGYRIGQDSTEVVKNFFLSYPTDDINEIPLGINLGVMLHEFTHYLSFHLYKLDFMRKAGSVSKLSTKTWNTIRAIDEGMADYFGFLITKDPGFLLCSLASADRDLSVKKELTPTQKSSLESDDDSDPHKVGAVIASILYEIGKTDGNYDEVGKSILTTMDNMLSCATVDGTSIDFDLGDFRDCHLKYLGSRANSAKTIYTDQYNGLY